MTDKLSLDEFSVRQINKYGIFVMKDNVTGVEYIITVISDTHSVTPRLNSDGSLYCGSNSQKEAEA